MWGKIALCTTIIWQEATQISVAVYFFKEMTIDEDSYIVPFADLEYFGLLGADPQSDFLSTILQVVCHMPHGFSLSIQQCSAICKVQIGEATISPLDTKVCRVHDLPHHIVDNDNEEECQQYTTLPVSRGSGEERFNTSGCLDAATNLVVQHLENGDISLWNTIGTKHFPPWKLMDAVKCLFEVYKIDNQLLLALKTLLSDGVQYEDLFSTGLSISEIRLFFLKYKAYLSFYH